ncbi:MAG: GerMN domain-containing protein [Oscillospiraceae bacterium]|nr:GerMN domain-containing protein [Oscillospiraceae bacterium]
MKLRPKAGVWVLHFARNPGGFRRIVAFSFSLLLLFSLPGCEKQPERDGTHLTFSIYYVVTSQKERQFGEEIVRPVAKTFSAADATPETLLRLLLSAPPDTELSSPFPAGTSVRSLKIEGKRAILDLSASYSVLSGYDLTVSSYCIALTLTQLPSIDEVSITVDGKDLSGGAEKILRAEDVVLNDIEKEYTSIEAALYFLSADGTSLQPEYRKISIKEEDDLARRIVEALINGPETSSLRRLAPAHTELVNLSVQNGCCKLTLSDAFWSKIPSDPKLQMLAIYSIVNSLTNLNSITEVQFYTIQGAAASYGSVVLRQPLSHNSQLSQTARQTAG